MGLRGPSALLARVLVSLCVCFFLWWWPRRVAAHGPIHRGELGVWRSACPKV
ncbi:hypothetical protein BU14_0240s0010 [Porphyra umbilicalis]|uniref:Uncharacterized protein n=1 Tax=Porphyra umbilicalis TaxID=2786 RepID=A0A1X6P357_PORUM|nr:hypothetical protein BU14_0240s0010 [Porphyra umbilicalis]|eukprot:OSX75332.1 hypothetical protein BU14_0240s0010 [Porphyra umbilicalis]